MPRITAIIFLFSLLGSSLHNTAVWLEFEWNKDYYATEKCVYKDVEGNDCQGSCQIRAILQGESHEPAPQVQYQEESIVLISPEIFDWEIIKPQLKERKQTTYQVYNLLKGSSLGIWRPPKV